MLPDLLRQEIHKLLAPSYKAVSTDNNQTYQCGFYCCYKKRDNQWYIMHSDYTTEIYHSYDLLDAIAMMQLFNGFNELSPALQEKYSHYLPTRVLKLLEEEKRNAPLPPKHPGGRPKSLIPRRYKKFWVSEEEIIAIKELLAQMRGKKPQ